MEDLKASVLFVEDKVALIRCEGFVDTVTVPVVEKKIHECLQKGTYRIVVDLSLVNYVSSAGWGVFVSEIKDLRAKKGDLILSGMSPEVFDVYELMEFSAILKSFDQVGDALASFGVKVPSELAPVDPSVGMKKGGNPTSASVASPGPSAPANKKKGFFRFGR